MDWPSLSDPTSFRFFDEFGNELTDPDKQENSVFTAYVDIPDTPLSLSSAGGSENTHGRKVIIFIADNPGERGQRIIESYRSEEKASRNLHLYSSTVVNLDK